MVPYSKKYPNLCMYIEIEKINKCTLRNLEYMSTTFTIIGGTYNIFSLEAIQEYLINERIRISEGNLDTQSLELQAFFSIFFFNLYFQSHLNFDTEFNMEVLNI